MVDLDLNSRLSCCYRAGQQGEVKQAEAGPTRCCAAFELLIRIPYSLLGFLIIYQFVPFCAEDHVYREKEWGVETRLKTCHSSTPRRKDFPACPPPATLFWDVAVSGDCEHWYRGPVRQQAEGGRGENLPLTSSCLRRGWWYVEPLEPQAPKWEGIPASEHVDTRIMELRRCRRDLRGSQT